LGWSGRDVVECRIGRAIGQESHDAEGADGDDFAVRLDGHGEAHLAGGGDGVEISIW
jgi:hypothetical protein